MTDTVHRAAPRSLAHRAWRVLVGVKDALALLFLLLFFAAIYAALNARSDTAAIGRGALLLDLNGAIVEQPAPAQVSQSLSGRPRLQQFRLRDLVAAIDRARTDDRVKMIVLDLDGFAGGGHVAIEQVGEALRRVRAVKPVIAYATGYSDSSYLLAANASKVLMDPMGFTAIAGPGGSQPYFKGLVDKLGVNVHVYRVGKFKAAVEPFLLAKASPEAKAAAAALDTALWQDWQAKVAAARPQAKVAAFANDPVASLAGGNSLAQAAIANGLVDRLVDRPTLTREIAAQVGTGKRGIGFARIDQNAYLDAHQFRTGDVAGDVGIVTVAGTIVDGNAPAGTAGGDTIARLIDRAVAGNRVKAIVLRVDSPGGSALASERIRASLAAAKAKGMPIVVSMGDVAASGGYWVTTVADKVFAEPATITGSIGVFGIVPTLENALGKVGITGDGVRTTPLSGQPDLIAGTSPAFDTLVQKSIENTYGRFIALVAGARHLAPARVDEIAQGRVWDGGSARQLGLVDAFGGLDDAIADAARRVKVSEPSVVWIEKPPSWLEAIAASFNDPAPASGDTLAMLARGQSARLVAALIDTRLLVRGASVQARCFECPVPLTTTMPPLTMIERLVATQGGWLLGAS
jgi:protease-4